MGVGHDVEVLDWQDNLKELISECSCTIVICSQSTCAQVGGSTPSTSHGDIFDGQYEFNDESSTVTEGDDDDSLSGESVCAPQFPPVQYNDDDDVDNYEYKDTSDDNDNDDEEDDDDDGLDALCVCLSVFILAAFLVLQSCSSDNPMPGVETASSLSNCQSASLIPAYQNGTFGNFSFKIVIDNIDMSVKSRFMRLDTYRNKSLHYINLYAVLGRINFCELLDVHPYTCSNSPDKNALLLLPSADDDKSIRSLFMTPVARVLVSNMSFLLMKW